MNLTCRPIALAATFALLGLIGASRSEAQADLCVADGGTAKCVAPEVGEYQIWVGSTGVPGTVGPIASETPGIESVVNAIVTSQKACSSNLTYYPWVSLPGSLPSGSGQRQVGVPGSNDFHTQSWKYGSESHQLKNNYSLFFTYAQTSSPPCASQNTAWWGATRNRLVECPTGFGPNYPATTHCYAPGGAIDPPKNLGPCNDCEALTGNPVNVATGNKFQVERDYRSSGSFPLEYTRYYNSLAQTYSQPAPTGPNIFRNTPNWQGTYDRAVLFSEHYRFPAARAYREDGKVILFNYVGGNFVPDADVDERLTRQVDVNGNTSGWTLVNSRDETETYDDAGRLTLIRSRAGITHTLAYDASGRLASVTHSFGQQLIFTYDAQNKLSTMTVPGGGVYTYGYAWPDNLKSVTMPGGAVRTYHYENGSYSRALTGITDESSIRFATFGYASNGKANLSEHAGGVDRWQFTYSSATSTVVTDPLNTARTFTLGNVLGTANVGAISQLCPTCGTASKSKTFDANGNVASRTNFNNVQTTYGYDLARNLETSRTEAFGTPQARTITTAWHAGYRTPASITEPNRMTTFTHDTAGNVLTRTVTDTSVVPNVARTWIYTYNSFGQVLSEDGPRTDVSDVTVYTYYSCTTGFQCGQVNTITNAVGHVTTYNSYNASGQPTQMTDANGLMTALAYDARQRLIDRCSGSYLPGCSGGELTHLDYWPTGLLKKVTNPDASYIEYTYDSAHRLTQINDGTGNKVVYTLDNAGNRTAENTYDPTLVLKRTHSRVFNSLNQLWKDVNAAGTVNVTTVFGYDNNGNQTTVNAPLSRNTTNLYDELNRLKQITDPASGNTLFGYDANDNLTSVTDPRTLVTSYTYNGFGDLTTQASPDTGLTTNTYDSGGNLKTSTDARSALATYTYDVLNRVTSAAFKIGSTTDQTIAYTYDAGANGKGHLTGASDAKHSMAWTYDAQGRVTGKGQVVGTFNKSVGYGYNTTGQLASTVLPSGNTITYGYNSNGQVTSVTLNGAPNVTILSNVLYDPFGPIAGWTWGNGTTMSRSFDTDGKLTAIANSPTTVGNRGLGFDDAFRITSTTDSATSGPSWTLGYDILDRLNSATKTGTTIGYTYDASGNRLTQTGTNASAYTVSGTSNKLSTTTGALARTYTYDAVGNVLTSGATIHTYNNRGRMKTGRLTSTGTNTNYTYNALGQRIRKATNASNGTAYMYDEAGHLVGEYTYSSGALVQETVWLGDIPVATIRSVSGVMKVFYVHTDQLNAPRKVTNTSNTVRWKWDPTPFGEGTPTEPAGAFKYNLRFPGQYFDAETNFNYNYFREYDPAVGRYVESDPIGLAAGVNTYGYVSSMPISRIDPFGLQTSGPCPMGQRSRPIPGVANGYRCVDDDRAANDPPYCPTGMCAVYPLDPPKPEPTCEQQCEDLRKKCLRLVDWYPAAARIAGGLLGAAGGRAGGAGGAIGGGVGGSVTGAAPQIIEGMTGMNQSGLVAGCENGAKKCKAACNCEKPK